MGTLLGIKGVDPSPGVSRRVSTLKPELAQGGVDVPVFVDGGIRGDTVEPLADAGADGVIPGSLVFGHPDPCTAVRWLQSLGSRDPSIEPTQPGGTQP